MRYGADFSLWPQKAELVATTLFAGRYNIDVGSIENHEKSMTKEMIWKQVPYCLVKSSSVGKQWMVTILVLEELSGIQMSHQRYAYLLKKKRTEIKRQRTSRLAVSDFWVI